MGDKFLSEEECSSLRCCSFPDIVVQNEQESIIFISKIGCYYCYCMFITKMDHSATRGFRQYTISIVCPYAYFYPFTRLLHSTLFLGDMIPSDVIVFLYDFLIKWFDNIPQQPGTIVELPMFDGTLPVAISDIHDQLIKFHGGYEWSPLCKVYYLNDHFLGGDLVTAFSIQSLIDQGRSADVLRLWEAVILDESILVYGANPSIVSQACLAIASLTFPESVPEKLIPFLSITDPRFQQLSKGKVPKGLILGVSNPIALTKSELFNLKFVTGFVDENNGLESSIIQWHLLKQVSNSTSSDLREVFYSNVLKLVDAINQYLNALRAYNPYAEFCGQFETTALETFVLKKDIRLYHATKQFTKSLMRSNFLARVWSRRCNKDSLMKQLEMFTIDRICKGLQEHELIDIYSTIESVKKRFGNDSVLSTYIERDLAIVKSFLSSDLLLGQN